MTTNVWFSNKGYITYVSSSSSAQFILDKVTYAHDLKDFSFTFLELPKFKKGEKELDQLEELNVIKASVKTS